MQFPFSHPMAVEIALCFIRSQVAPQLKDSSVDEGWRSSSGSNRV